MAAKILVMGLPGAGKTYLSKALYEYLNRNNVSVDWFNADDVRKKYNDWDFSNEGRLRQSLRMFKFAMEYTGDFVICDFVAPLTEMRNNFKADWTIWMDTITEGRFTDTNKIFVPPDAYDFRITEQNAEKWAPIVGQKILQGKK